MLVPQQAALKTGVLAPAVASGNAVAALARSSKDPPPPKRYHLAASPPGRRCHDAGALVVTPAGPVNGRRPKVRHRAGNRDTP